MEPEPKRRKGGVRQRMAEATSEVKAVDASVAAEAAPSQLATFLKQQWGWGRFSPQQVQHMAELARLDMEAAGCSAVPSNLSGLAKMGTSGKYANNVHRDLMKLVQHDSKLPEPLFVSLPFKAHESAQAVMLPHLIFHCLWKHYRSYWEAIFYLLVLKGWCSFGSISSHTPACLASEATRPSGNPLCLHGDGVPTIGCGKVWAKLMQAYSFSCLLARGSTKERSLYLRGVFEQTLKHGAEVFCSFFGPSSLEPQGWWLQCLQV